MMSFEEMQSIASKVESIVKCRPTIGIVCGSGLGGLAEQVEDKEVIPYADLDCFPKINSSVKGHSKQLVFGKLSDKQVVLMQGRIHFYEGIPIGQAAQGPRLLKLLGVKTLILTNAAGSLNPDYKVGDFMLLRDHINLPGLSGFNPLMGHNDERWGPRFKCTSDLYSRKLATLMKKTVAQTALHHLFHEGTYVFESGPSFESIAECKYLRSIGADAVGMSTVPEALVAHHCGLEVCAMSLITNCAVMDYDREDHANHAEVLETGELRAVDMKRLIAEFVNCL